MINRCQLAMIALSAMSVSYVARSENLICVDTTFAIAGIEISPHIANQRTIENIRISLNLPSQRQSEHTASRQLVDKDEQIEKMTDAYLSVSEYVNEFQYVDLESTDVRNLIDSGYGFMLVDHIMAKNSDQILQILRETSHGDIRIMLRAISGGFSKETLEQLHGLVPNLSILPPASFTGRWKTPLEVAIKSENVDALLFLLEKNYDFSAEQNKALWLLEKSSDIEFRKIVNQIFEFQAGITDSGTGIKNNYFDDFSKNGEARELDEKAKLLSEYAILVDKWPTLVLTPNQRCENKNVRMLKIRELDEVNANSPINANDLRGLVLREIARAQLEDALLSEGFEKQIYIVKKVKDLVNKEDWQNIRDLIKSSADEQIRTVVVLALIRNKANFEDLSTLVLSQAINDKNFVLLLYMEQFEDWIKLIERNGIETDVYDRFCRGRDFYLYNYNQESELVMQIEKEKQRPSKDCSKNDYIDAKFLHNAYDTKL